ncbi:hypothetical protein KCU81_g8705, partial [Aureobasidium melanogenum]|uniref:ATP-dependent DNA helicase n=1 Tax=Aureobasidium melanogenum (strain CBS 110374) TaxID=1043003 RepID=A0A074VVT1_AURM1
MASVLDTGFSAVILKSHNPKKQEVLAEGAEAFSAFFEDCRNAFHQEYTRPRKRAKLELAENLDSAHTFSGPGITIARLDINLRPSANTTNHNDLSTVLGDDIEVGLVDACDLTSSQPTLSLVGHAGYKKSPLLQIQTTNSISSSTADLLSRIVSLEKRSRRNVKPGICRSTCLLHRSAGSPGPVYTLECSITWSDGESAFGPLATKKEDWTTLTQFFPEPKNVQPKSWTPQEFYASVHSPPNDASIPELIECKVLESDLYPFQKRAVAWMLGRETPSHDHSQKRLSYTQLHDAMGQPCFVSHLEGVVCSPTHFAAFEEPQGGVLSEEMGLGKTVELIALICLNKQDSTEVATEDAVTQPFVKSRATLIVTPPTILQQWKDELARHAPGLSVLHYKGVSDAQSSKKGDQSIVADLAQRDVVLTTYSVLAKEVYFAVDPPERSLRQREHKRTRPRSPLVQMYWWRVCLDEAQMVESGVSAAAQVASLLPRKHAWAVSGTPLKKDVQDLFGLLVFLRYQPYCNSSAIWNRLIHQYGDVFKTLFGRITLRHTKDQVRHELRLPLQRRVVLTLPFTQIEDQNYKTLFETMCEECGCNFDGSPLTHSWDPESPALLARMRTWLCQLRQTCLHPQVGGRNRRALGRGQGPLRTVAEVLEVMIDQNETSIRTESRLVINTQLLRGHIIGNAKDDEHRAEKALEVYKSALEASEQIVAECRADLARTATHGIDHEKKIDDSEDEKSAEEIAEGRHKVSLYFALQLQHACAFFVGTSYFQMKSNTNITEPDSDKFRELEAQESLFYDTAKLTRKEILNEESSKAERLMQKIEQEKDVILERSGLAAMESPGGVENVKIIHKAHDLARIMNAQAKLIDEWKQKATDLLLKPLVDKDDENVETTGDEYEDSTKSQDTLNAYLDALRALVADRSTCITGQSAPLVDQEVKSLIQMAKLGNGHAPELILELLAERNRLKQKPDDVLSLRGLVHEIRGIETALDWQDGNARASAELQIIRSQAKQLGLIAERETKVLKSLEEMIELFSATMNKRLDFYRQLQVISDTVAPYKEEWDDTLDVVALEAATRRQETQTKALAALKTKNRFLLHLREESTNSQETQRICVICQGSFEQGVLTVCGHQYCKECINHWWSSHRTCPVCKRHLVLADFHQITYKPQELLAQEEQSEPSSPNQGSSKSATPGSTLYADINTETLAQIKSIDLNGSFGTKIDTLARHILWIRKHDPGAKAIVFSQFREFLDVLGTAFKQFGVGYSRMGKPGAVDRFRNDAGIECFLLDAKTDSSGLNLVNAQYVFLAEPLINTAIELQAIARVHRIGQQRPTTVYMYLIGDTVEEAIYEISVARRLAHMQKATNNIKKESQRSKSSTPALGEAAIDAANSLELQQAPVSKLLVQGKGDGEVVPNDDLWSCLFSRAAKSQRQQQQPVLVSAELEAEVGRHLRAEAAENRRG